MIETLTVSLSGPAFSFLLFENMKHQYGQEGFLLGELVEKKTNAITDNDEKQVYVSRIVKVNASVPCPHLCYFYDSIGRIDIDKIKNFLGNLSAKVVAWYKYRPSAGFCFTFRERLVHKQLAELFEVPIEYFTCCLLISESSDNGSTHSFTQDFVRYHNQVYEHLPLHITNLSDSNNTYKNPEHVSETFLNILKGLQINHKKSQGLTIITKIQNALQKQTNHLVENLSEAEERLFQLELEVEKIKAIMGNKQLNESTETQINDFNKMDSEENETPRSARKPKIITKSEKRVSPTKKASVEGSHTVNTRSRKRY